MEQTAAQWVAAEVRAELARTRKSQSDLAEHLGISRASLSRRLSGVTPLDVNDLEAIADWLDVPLSQFTTRAAS